MSDITHLLSHAATLMATGMVVVFVFLTVLVYLVRLLSFLAPSEPVPVEVAQVEVAVNSKPHPHIVAAISAAVHQYRQSK